MESNTEIDPGPDRQMEHSIHNLDNLSRKFLCGLKQVFSPDVFRSEFTDRLIVTIPARDTEVGDMTVWLDGVEITVGVGKLYHGHFEVNWESLPTLDEREDATVETAINYIRDVLNDRIHFEVWFEAGICRGGRSWHPDCSEQTCPLAGVDEVREYVWSHRIK